MAPACPTSTASNAHSYARHPALKCISDLPRKTLLGLNPQGTCMSSRQFSLKPSYSQLRPPSLGTHSVPMAPTLAPFALLQLHGISPGPAVGPQPSHRDTGVPRGLALTPVSPWQMDIQSLLCL